MGDGLKLAKDKRHRSSSSLAGAVLEGTRSERKLDMNVSIPEMDDQFATAEARCDDLQEKIDLIKSLKRKRKLKKRSMTRVTEQPMTPENVPFITVRTQPKKKVSQQTARLRRLEVPPNPTRGYLDPATVEQHRMIGQVRGYTQAFKHPHERNALSTSVDQRLYSKARRQRSQADGDIDDFIDEGLCGQHATMSNEEPLEVACGQDEIGEDYVNFDIYERPAEFSLTTPKKPMEVRQTKQQPSRRRHVPKESLPKEEEAVEAWRSNTTSDLPRRRTSTRSHQSSATGTHTDDRPVVELFNKSRTSPTDVRRLPQSPAALEKKARRARNLRTEKFDDQSTGPLETIQIEPKKEPSHPRRVKYRSRRYELPTVASQMKQACGMRYYYGTSNHTNIPFVVSKSTAPSHNIGVNIQQVLNGLKVQQPLSGIPLTIAHHMGLGHVPTYGPKNAAMQPSLDHREINAIKVGRKLLRLPSYKFMSYNRLLSLYREGDGMVPRFLRAIARPHYFYTSMYNLATNRDDYDGATSKGRGGGHEAKQSLAEYASLYREYEHIDKCINEGNYEPELERRRDDLTRELAAREEHIRRVVQEYRTSGEPDQAIRASVSTTEEGYRHSTFKMTDTQQ
ncbi:unnamed protein product [Chrysodeixis includens]|uniref:Uncharacterized protein n=1 Tax=Chrysodeixis includens TaxID=689277 RepID=A0A9N8KTC4_CHRIL|nr:unnamed protein product [Chrysodeixis includens]